MFKVQDIVIIQKEICSQHYSYSSFPPVPTIANMHEIFEKVHGCYILISKVLQGSFFCDRG